MRRFRRSFRGRSQKAPTIWQRASNTLSTGAAGALAGLEVVDSDFLMSNTELSTDQRYTLKRLILNLTWRVTTAFSAGTALVVLAGICCKGDGEPLRDPQLLTNDDTRTDWLWLGAMSGFGLASVVGDNLDSNQGIRRIDIRTSRKMTSMMSPFLSIKAIDTITGAAPAAGIVQCRYQVSALWSKTRR